MAIKKAPDHMIRKQIHLCPRQNLILKYLARQRGVSESEIIRQAIEREAKIIAPVQSAETALANMLAFIEKRKAIYAGQGEPFQWNRADIYKERES
jgi:hypothetical protein